MPSYLKTNTATIVVVGPFLDKTDGVTLETSLTITNERITVIGENYDGSAPTLILDNVTGATSATDNDLNYITSNDAAMMQLELSAANLNRLGRLWVIVTDAANHLPVWHEFIILPANVFDSLVLGTDVLQADVTQLAGVAQSLTDLKDFADDGYDPSTNKVQGVVLTDTVTTYTGNTPQTGDSFARLGAPAGASVSADIAAIEAQTNDIGAAGAGLTAIPWNNADWDAEVQSEVQDALEANHLDHLLAATYDPASKPGAADALLNELIGNDGGVSQFTANALELAPSGAGTSPLEIVSGTVASASDFQLDLGTLGLGNDELNDYLIRVLDNSTGEYHARWIGDFTGSTSLATLDTVLPFTTESGVDTFVVYALRRDQQKIKVGTASGEVTITAGTVNANLVQITGDGNILSFILQSFLYGSIDSSTTTSVTFNTPISALSGNVTPDSNSLRNWLLATRDGGNLQVSVISAYNSGTLTATVSPAFATAPSGQFAIFPASLLASQIQTGLDTDLAAILADTNELQTDWTNGGRLDLIIDELTAQGDTNQSKIDVIDGIVDTILVDTADLNDTALPDSVPADGALPTLKQAIYMIAQFLMEREVAGTTMTVKKVDGTTSLLTFTLDDATTPTAITRAT